MQSYKKARVLIIHNEFFTSYFNKNIGYFIKQCILMGYSVDFLSLEGRCEPLRDTNPIGFNLIKIRALKIDSAKFIFRIARCAYKYDYAWIYPFYRMLPLILFLLKVSGVKVILKSDSIPLVRPNNRGIWRIIKQCYAALIHQLCFRILVESDNLLEGLPLKGRVRLFYLGLPADNLNIIRDESQKIMRTKTILYLGRISYAKGLDLLVNAFIKLCDEKKLGYEWNLRAVGRPVETEYVNYVQSLAKNSKVPERICFSDEKSGRDYYREILASSLVVLPSRSSEGLPNVMADALFCRTIFLATDISKSSNIIKNNRLLCSSSVAGLKSAIMYCIENLQELEKKYDEQYELSKLVCTDSFFSDLLQGV